jgi:hypothetical protein
MIDNLPPLLPPFFSHPHQHRKAPLSEPLEGSPNECTVIIYLTTSEIVDTAIRQHNREFCLDTTQQRTKKNVEVSPTRPVGQGLW